MLKDYLKVKKPFPMFQKINETWILLAVWQFRNKFQK